jgi:hypothetical protein
MVNDIIVYYNRLRKIVHWNGLYMEQGDNMEQGDRLVVRNH